MPAGGRLLPDAADRAPAEIARLGTGIARVAGEGFESPFACVYDELYRIFTGLSPLLAPILGEHYLFVPETFSAFFIDVGPCSAASVATF